MPNAASWNGKWSGEGRCYAIVKNFPGKKGEAKAAEILAKRSYYYGWSDGWGASVSVKMVTPAESRSYRKRSVGFAGYDWMVASIIRYGKIYATHEEPKAESTVTA